MDDNQARIQAALGDKYDIKEIIKSGGMGKIFLGIHRALGKKVAIKIIHQELISNTEIKSRFSREAKLSASLDHSGIIKIEDFGSHDDFDYIIMPYIDGGTLQEKLKKHGPINIKKALVIIREITEALYFAHCRHVVHRDIKPANIMFNKQEKIIIADFGISKDLDNSDLTLPDTIMGSPKYMSPEQINGDPVDARSDLYSLGIVCYEILTGEHPFKGKGRTALYHCQLHEIPVRPDTLCDDIPRQLGNIIMKCLEKSPEKRYASGGEVLKDLDDFESGNVTFSAEFDDGARMLGDGDATEEEGLTSVPWGTAGSMGVNSVQPGFQVFLQKHIRKIALAGGVCLCLIFLLLFSGGAEDKEKTGTADNVSSPSTLGGHPSQGLEPVPSGSLRDLVFAIGNGEIDDGFTFWTDRKRYRIGEKIGYHFKSEKPCYAIILGFTTQGQVIQMFPNYYHSSQLVIKNKIYSVPGGQMEFDLEVTGPPGQDTMVALISAKPFKLFDGEFDESNPFLLLERNDGPAVSGLRRNILAIKNNNISQKRLVYTILD